MWMTLFTIAFAGAALAAGIAVFLAPRPEEDKGRWDDGSAGQ
jgi:hypothetical protein